MKFFNEHTELYKNLIQPVADVYAEFSVIENLNNFYGTTKKVYRTVLVSLFDNGWYGVKRVNGDKEEIYCVISPLSEFNGEPWFARKEYIRTISYHEFGHSYVNLFTDEFMERLEESFYLFTRQKKNGSWLNDMEESMVVSCALYASEAMPSEILQTLKRNYDGGNIYINDIHRYIEDYVNDRETYPTFDDFIPVIFERLMQEYPEED